MIHGSMQAYPLTLDKILDHAAHWDPEVEVSTARSDGSVVRTNYADIRDHSLRISSVLAGFGIGIGDRVATLAWNSQAHVETWYGIMGMGAVCHTLNPRLTVAQLAAMVVESDAKILIASGDLLPIALEIAARAPSIVHVLTIDGDDNADTSNPVGAARGVEELESLIGDAEPIATWGQFDETSPCGLCFTSGTTGAPKGVTYTHRSSFLHTLRILQVDVMAISRRDTVLAMVPMFHANAWGLPFALPAVGGRLVLPGRQADGASLARLIDREKVTIGVGVPTVWLGLVEHLETTGGQLPSLRRIIVGGAPMAPALMARIEGRLGVTVQTSWGMTELSPSGTVSPPDDPQRAASVSGRPALGVDLLLTDSDGIALPDQRGHEGHLRVRGAAVVERYFGHEQPATDAQGWFPTGDLARIDAHGNLTITGRSKDLIKSGGEWINPAEIEAVVGALPEVSLAAVIGRTDAKWGERPILLVELNGGEPVDDEVLLEPVRRRLASWWVPDAVIRLAEMPLAATGKIDKLKLRAEYGSD